MLIYIKRCYASDRTCSHDEYVHRISLETRTTLEHKKPPHKRFYSDHIMRSILSYIIRGMIFCSFFDFQMGFGAVVWQAFLVAEITTAVAGTLTTLLFKKKHALLLCMSTNLICTRVRTSVYFHLRFTFCISQFKLTYRSARLIYTRARAQTHVHKTSHA